MTSREIREQFLNFFKNKDHRIVQSAPVVPFDDPTLLFTNAGMNQFKDVFLGTGSREYKRAADTQKCIRVSGKHNDLEEVGHDTYHHTFFEMLGNWSFGDYYKAEAIQWAWELLTEVWKLPKERLWATVYRTDDEAMELWKSKTDINPNHIIKFDEKDNFWEMGETGPCGPCSEIHINLSDNLEDGSLVNAGTEDCIEIWNLVFIQYNRDSEGKLHDLPDKHVDTGMGFERVCAVLQKKRSNYDTDVFSPVIDEIGKIAGKSYEVEANKTPMRVIADHIRTLSFAIADGAVPGNEGRGYVLRRILRRAARYGRKLELNKPFMFKLVDVLSATMGDVFPELIEKQEYVKKIIKAEEESFNATLDRGIELFEQITKKLNKEGKKLIPGEELFRLYDTYGFPVDLTNVMAKEKGFEIDEEKFTELMEGQRKKAREATKDKFASVNISTSDINDFHINDQHATEFTGYDEMITPGIIVGHKKEGENDLVILNKTPFYVEAGGQIDDLGNLVTDQTSLPVIDVSKIEDRVIHLLHNNNNVPLIHGLNLTAQIDVKRRWDIQRNHSATHFLHAALRSILGTHVQQAGSYVGPDRLRFDFTHFAKVSEPELKEIETMVNEKLRERIPLQHHRAIPFDEAKKMGALMFFGDKYGDRVNVVQFGEFSKEFCGGTHVQNSSDIGLFKIISESSIASGVRRIEAVTGSGVEDYIYNQIVNAKLTEEKISALLDEKKKLEKEIAALKVKAKLGQLENITSSPSGNIEIPLFKGIIKSESMEELRSIGEEFANKIKSGVGILMSDIDGKAGIVAIVTADLIKEKKLSAGKIVGELAKLVNGGGGGRPDFATAGGKEGKKIRDAFEAVENTIKAMI
jgi:alanyl-tRNA synthetase